MKKLSVLFVLLLTVSTAAFAQTEMTSDAAAIGDAAADVMVWQSTTDETVTALIAANADGLSVHTMDGEAVQAVELPDAMDIDLRYNVPMGDRNVTLLAVGVDDSSRVRLFEVTEPAGELSPMGEANFGITNGGLCLYQSATETNIIVTSPDGLMEQRGIGLDDAGEIDAPLLRQYIIGDSLAGCVTDDAQGTLYINEPGVTIWKYCADAVHGEMSDIDFARKYGIDYDRELERNSIIDPDGDVPAVGKLALHTMDETTGYLMATVNETNQVLVFDRGAENDMLGTLTLSQTSAVNGVAAYPEALAAATVDGTLLFAWDSVIGAVGAPLETALAE